MMLKNVHTLALQWVSIDYGGLLESSNAGHYGEEGKKDGEDLVHVGTVNACCW